MRGRGNFFYLLAGLLFYVLVAPLVTQWSSVARQVLVTLPLTAALVIGVWSLAELLPLDAGWVGACGRLGDAQHLEHAGSL